MEMFWFHIQPLGDLCWLWLQDTISVHVWGLPCIFNPSPPYYRHVLLISSSRSGPTAALAGKHLRGADNKLKYLREARHRGAGCRWSNRPRSLSAVTHQDGNVASVSTWSGGNKNNSVCTHGDGDSLLLLYRTPGRGKCDRINWTSKVILTLLYFWSCVISADIKQTGQDITGIYTASLIYIDNVDSFQCRTCRTGW